MSVEAIAWALKRHLGCSSAKTVLIVMANMCNAEDGRAYPSIAYLCEATDQNRKTVIQNLKRLVDWGLIEATTERVGRTGQIVVYRVLMTPDLFETAGGQGSQNRDRSATAKQAQNRDCLELRKESRNRNRSENGTVPKAAAKSPNFGFKESQKRDTETSGNVRKQYAHSAGAREDADQGEAEALANLHRRAVEATVELRKLGVPDVTPIRPELINLLAAGATLAQLTLTAEELTAKKGQPPNLGYLAATLFGRAADAANLNPGGHDVAAIGPAPAGGHQRQRPETLAERVERRYREGNAAEDAAGESWAAAAGAGADALDYEPASDLAHYIRERLPRAPKAPAAPREPLRESARRVALAELAQAARDAGLGTDDDR